MSALYVQVKISVEPGTAHSHVEAMAPVIEEITKDIPADEAP